MPRSLAQSQSRDARLNAILQFTQRTPKSVQQIADYLGMSYGGAWNYVQALMRVGKLHGAAIMHNHSATYQSRPVGAVPEIYNAALNKLVPLDDFVLLPGVKTEAEEMMSKFGLYMTELFSAIQHADMQRMYDIKQVLNDTYYRLKTFSEVIKQVLDNSDFDKQESLEAVSQTIPDAVYAKVALRRQMWAEYTSERSLSEVDEGEAIANAARLLEALPNLTDEETDESETSMPEN